ncbi:fibronectin type III domain-containing protein [Desulfofundulus salinus]|uniref:fibronectin type III domain-containing protein n=1 Tax=Desulfofundulus salinus TaxID=2419843 RepID=UPI001402054A|nr:fibronectin type III domain-containing protein [Desulfofundulus salinum]
MEWNSNGSHIDADWVQLWRTDSTSGIWMPVKDITGSEINSFTWTDTMVTAGLNYKYQIRAYNTSNWSWDVIWESDWAVNPRPFNAPGGLKVTYRGDTTATVTWTPVNGADQYQVQVSTDGGVTWQTSTVSGPPVTVPRPCQVRVKAGTHARSQWSGVLTVQ